MKIAKAHHVSPAQVILRWEIQEGLLTIPGATNPDYIHAPPVEQESFSERLFRIIDKKHLADVDVYKRANLDRKLFSKLRNKAYKPGKKTVLALAIALSLSLDEAVDLLRYAGFALAPNDKQDIVVRYCLERKIYDIHMVNIIMFEYADKTL